MPGKASNTFKGAFDKWLLENTKELPLGEDGYCPACKQWAGEDFNLIACFGSESNVAASMESGPWDACDWQELRWCGCGEFFTADNSNY